VTGPSGSASVRETLPLLQSSAAERTQSAEPDDFSKVDGSARSADPSQPIPYETSLRSASGRAPAGPSKGSAYPGLHGLCVPGSAYPGLHTGFAVPGSACPASACPGLYARVCMLGLCIPGSANEWRSRRRRPDVERSETSSGIGSCFAQRNRSERGEAPLGGGSRRQPAGGRCGPLSEARSAEGIKRGLFRKSSGLGEPRGTARQAGPT